jgi:hypothetical protein
MNGEDDAFQRFGRAERNALNAKLARVFSTDVPLALTAREKEMFEWAKMRARRG